MKLTDFSEGWSDKYKKSIDCSNPKGFSQKAHCAGKKKKKKNESLIREWWEEWQQATSNFPQIKQFMGQYGYNANSKRHVQDFVNQNPEYIDAIGKAYGKYADIGGIMARAYGKTQGMSTSDVNKALSIRDQVKDKYPGAFKKLKSGDAVGALKDIGITEEIAKWLLERAKFVIKELKIEKPDSVDTKGIKRSEMPQVATKDYPEFIEYLKDNGAEFTKQTMPAKALKATQGEFSDAGVEKQLQKMQDGAPKKPIIASEDNYIIDGHHRWLVAWNTKSAVEVFKVNMDADELLKLVKKFPKTTYKDIYTEELYDFDKEEPMKSTVAVPGYGTMSIEGLMKNLVQSAMELVDRMKQGTDGMRFADYQLNNNKVFLTKLSALIDALDGLQAIRKQGGARSRNIQKEQEEEQQELPIDTDKVFRYIQQLESRQNVKPEDADLMRRGVQSLTANRQTLNPQAILQLLTILT